MRIDDSKYNKEFRILLNPVDYIDYKAQPKTALAELLRAVNREKKKVEKDVEKQRIIEAAKNEINRKVKDYYVLLGQQDIILKDLYAKNEIVGKTQKQCPVCGKEVLIRSSYCDKCGWQFPNLYSLDDGETPICDESQLKLARANWQSIGNLAVLQHDIKCKEEEIEKEKFKNAELSRQYEALERRKKEIEEKLRKKEGERADEEKFDQEGIDFKERLFNVENTSFKMVYVEGGRFQMETSDNNDENHKRWVKLKDYYIGETVVTQALWKAVMGEKSNPSNWKGDELPVETVSWNDAKEFIEKLNEQLDWWLSDKAKFRLPTEAEWEYAARGGSKSDKKYKYSGSNTIDEVAWYEDNSWYKTHIVKRKKANELGLYDMSGNVWEWCEDNYGPHRVLRGGSWESSPGDCCVTFRSCGDPLNRNRIIGFRIVLASCIVAPDVSL